MAGASHPVKMVSPPLVHLLGSLHGLHHGSILLQLAFFNSQHTIFHKILRSLLLSSYINRKILPENIKLSRTSWKHSNVYLSNLSPMKIYNWSKGQLNGRLVQQHRILAASLFHTASMHMRPSCSQYLMTTTKGHMKVLLVEDKWILALAIRAAQTPGQNQVTRHFCKKSHPTKARTSRHFSTSPPALPPYMIQLYPTIPGLRLFSSAAPTLQTFKTAPTICQTLPNRPMPAKQRPRAFGFP